MDRREWTDITEDTNSLVPYRRDGREKQYQSYEQPWTEEEETEWIDITEDTNSLVPILPKTGTAMDGRD